MSVAVCAEFGVDVAAGAGEVGVPVGEVDVAVELSGVFAGMVIVSVALQGLGFDNDQKALT